MKITRRSLLGAATALPASLAMHRVARGQVMHRITVLHMNDFHSRHEAVDGRALSCVAGARPDCFGGAAKLATALAQERQAAEAAGRTVLLVDAGDQFQGSLFFTAWQGQAELDVMHALGTEVMTLGNHEFDAGPDVLGRFIRKAHFPVVATNVHAEAEPALDGLIKPSMLLDKAGLRIGIAGATTLETPVTSSPGPNLRFSDPATALARESAALRAQGAKLVIVLSHLGIDIDRRIAGTIPGMDVLVGGHSHTLLSDTEKDAAGPAHQVITGTAGATVVVQAACFGRYFGRLDLDVGGDGTVLAYGGDVRHVSLSLPDEPRVGAIVKSYADQLDAVRKRVVGHATEALSVATCRTAECALGSFVADAVLATTHGADVALLNGGGLRTGLPVGDITVGDVLTMLPYGNTVATLEIKGADLRAAVANGLSRAGAGAFPQVAGMRIGWNPLAAANERLNSLEIRGESGDFHPLDLNKTYRVVTNNFMRNGGDGYVAFQQKALSFYDQGAPLDQVISMAISKASPFAPQTDGRIFIR